MSGIICQSTGKEIAHDHHLGPNRLCGCEDATRCMRDTGFVPVPLGEFEGIAAPAPQAAGNVRDGSDTPSSLISAKEITRTAFSSWVERRKAILGDAAMSDDIVAELDPWLRAERDAGFTKLGEMVQRARDEIVELRKYWNGKGRAEALEEAALMVDEYGTDPLIAAAIRALKNKR